MTLLALSLFATARADALSIGSGLCAPSPKPCIKILETDGEIHPPYWLWEEARELGGEPRYIRVELDLAEGELALFLNGLQLTDRERSWSESVGSRHVWYVPVGSMDTEVELFARNVGAETAWFEGSIAGALEATP